MANNRLKGKITLITGGGSGYGRATALRFAEEGAATVYIIDRLQDRLDHVLPEISNRGSRAVGLCIDLRDRAACRQAMRQIQDEAGRLDVLVSNAGAWTQEAFIDMQSESWDYVLEVNLNASFILGQLAARMMREHNGGVILFTSSIDYKGAAKNFSHYAVAKSALVNLARCMAVELGPYNIRVNCVSPGPGDTQQSVDIVGEERMQEFRRHFPLVPLGQRLAAPEDMAAAFTFLASDDASYITGANLVVDGGLTAHAYSVPGETP